MVRSDLLVGTEIVCLDSGLKGLQRVGPGDHESEDGLNSRVPSRCLGLGSPFLLYFAGPQGRTLVRRQTPLTATCLCKSGMDS